jgi:hypothetical protein
MSSFIVSFRDTQAVGLAQQVTDCEWSAEIAHGDGTAFSQRVEITQAQPATVDLDTLVPGHGGAVAIAVKAIGGKVIISCSCYEAVVLNAGSTCWSSPAANAIQQIYLSTDEPAGIVHADLVVILAPGS